MYMNDKHPNGVGILLNVVATDEPLKVEPEALWRDVLRDGRIDRAGDEARDERNVHDIWKKLAQGDDGNGDVWQTEQGYHRRFDAVSGNGDQENRRLFAMVALTMEGRKSAAVVHGRGRRYR